MKAPSALDCGRSMDELNDYLASGETPRDQHIDTCDECQRALASLRELKTLTHELVDHDSQPHNQADHDWLGSIFGAIALEARAGRDIPLTPELPGLIAKTELSQTEGSVTALIRLIADEFDNLIIGRCRLHGDVTVVNEPILVDIRLTALLDNNAESVALFPLSTAFRTRVREALTQHTQLNIGPIDIAITDIIKHFRYGSATAQNMPHRVQKALSNASETSLIDDLNDVVLAVAGVNSLYPPKGALQAAADQLAAFVKRKDTPAVSTVAIEEDPPGLKITARIGVDQTARTPLVVTEVAQTVRNFIVTEIDADLPCLIVVHTVNIS